jgi:hypothetical protein
MKEILKKKKMAVGLGRRWHGWTGANGCKLQRPAMTPARLLRRAVAANYYRWLGAAMAADYRDWCGDYCKLYCCSDGCELQRLDR